MSGYATSEMGQQATSAGDRTGLFNPRADIGDGGCDVGFGPEADMLTTDEAQRFVDRPSLPLIDDLVRRH
jgi:hypothetical protein